jgi:hypothetical protein
METNLKFDISNDLFHAILGLMELAPVPHKHSNPVIQAFVGSQSKETVGEATVEGPVTNKPKRGRPPKAKLNGSTKQQASA